MKQCSLNTFLEEISPWLSGDYIRKAETNGKNHFILHFLDGTKHDYMIDDCNEEQVSKIMSDLKDQGIQVEGKNDE